MIDKEHNSYECIGLCDKVISKPVRYTKPIINIKKIMVKIRKQPKLTKNNINKRLYGY